MAKGIVIASLMVFCVLYEFKKIGAVTTWMVGDEFGWDPTTNMEAWSKGKKFYAGDILEFKYDADMFNVAIVPQYEHDKCIVNDKDQVFDSGDDKITIGFGATYFICTTVDDCRNGMKLAINATARPPLRWTRHSINGYN